MTALGKAAAGLDGLVLGCLGQPCQLTQSAYRSGGQCLDIFDGQQASRDRCVLGSKHLCGTQYLRREMHSTSWGHRVCGREKHLNADLRRKCF